MFLLLEKTINHKGILIITHIEEKWLNHFKKIGLTDDYFIYGHWCPGYPSNLTTTLAAYFTDNIFYQNRICDDTTKKVNELLNKLNVNVAIKDKFFDFIHVGRTCERKNQLETFKIMIKASKLFNKKSLLVLIKDQGNDPNFKYGKNILKQYDNLDSKTKKNIFIVDKINFENNDYCIQNSLDYEQLSLLFNYSKIYTHSTSGFDEARVISQALLSGCLLLCNSNMNGHKICRTDFKDCVVNYNLANIENDLLKILEKEKNYVFNEKLNDLYNESKTVVKELRRYYEECNFKGKMDFKTFFTKCEDKKLWSLKFPGHYNNIYWNVKKDDRWKYGNPTHHIQKEDQLKKFLEYINKIQLKI